MVKMAKIAVEKDILNTLNGFFKSMLDKMAADTLVIPQDVPSGYSTVQTLVKDPESVTSLNPFAFVLPANSADILVKTTDEATEDKIVALFRPCELRAVFELAKLHQIKMDNVTLVSVDCLGTLPVPEYVILAQKEGVGITFKLLKEVGHEAKTELKGIPLRTACQICEFPTIDTADISIGVMGVDMNKEILLSANTPKGEELLGALGIELSESDVPESRKKAIEALFKARGKSREKLSAEIREEIKDVKGFLKVLASCIKCHNCMNVCPICYCKECFFDSDILKPSPKQYMEKSRKRGVVRMPIDTALYHIGRMNHMITSCVSCGMCESACPSKLPLLALYHVYGSDVQDLFDYVAGRSLDEELPLATFKEEELEPV
ncbi:MAG: 4Fe-4S dicluster domain-containing protein [Thermoplasmata archaeon]|nr:MAG: 4Fe-4S dicluster domain-containing protein [Thermoplasmata archaeon]